MEQGEEKDVSKKTDSVILAIVIVPMFMAIVAGLSDHKDVATYALALLILDLLASCVLSIYTYMYGEEAWKRIERKIWNSVGARGG